MLRNQISTLPNELQSHLLDNQSLCALGQSSTFFKNQTATSRYVKMVLSSIESDIKQLEEFLKSNKNVKINYKNHFNYSYTCEYPHHGGLSAIDALSRRTQNYTKLATTLRSKILKCLLYPIMTFPRLTQSELRLFSGEISSQIKKLASRFESICSQNEFTVAELKMEADFVKGLPYAHVSIVFSTNKNKLSFFVSQDDQSSKQIYDNKFAEDDNVYPFLKGMNLKFENKEELLSFLFSLKSNENCLNYISFYRSAGLATYQLRCQIDTVINDFKSRDLTADRVEQRSCNIF